MSIENFEQQEQLASPEVAGASFIKKKLDSLNRASVDMAGSLAGFATIISGVALGMAVSPDASNLELASKLEGLFGGTGFAQLAAIIAILGGAAAITSMTKRLENRTEQ